jgi:Ca2+-binding EF-hand superfamily protein
MWQGSQYVALQELETAFNQFNSDKDGRITIQEQTQ